MLGRLSPLPLGTRTFSEYQGCHARRRRRPPSFALLANGDTRKWVLTGPVSLRDGMDGGREAELLSLLARQSR